MGRDAKAAARDAARAEVKDRIEEAANTLKRLPDRERAFLHDRGQAWPVMLRRVWEDAPKGAIGLRRPPPTARQIDRMHEVLDWLLALAKQDRDFYRAVWVMCAERRKPGEAGRILGCHRETARVWCANGLDRIAMQFGVRAAA